MRILARRKAIKPPKMEFKNPRQIETNFVFIPFVVRDRKAYGFSFGVELPTRMDLETLELVTGETEYYPISVKEDKLIFYYSNGIGIADLDLNIEKTVEVLCDSIAVSDKYLACMHGSDFKVYDENLEHVLAFSKTEDWLLSLITDRYIYIHNKNTGKTKMVNIENGEELEVTGYKIVPLAYVKCLNENYIMFSGEPFIYIAPESRLTKPEDPTKYLFPVYSEKWENQFTVSNKSLYLFPASRGKYVYLPLYTLVERSGGGGYVPSNFSFVKDFMPYVDYALLVFSGLIDYYSDISHIKMLRIDVKSWIGNGCTVLFSSLPEFPSMPEESWAFTYIAIDRYSGKDYLIITGVPPSGNGFTYVADVTGRW